MIARRNGNDWYLGAITNWEPRKLTVELDFLDSGESQMDAFSDGLNAASRAIDYKRFNRLLMLNLELQWIWYKVVVG